MYFMMLNEDLNHFGFQFHKGLNTDCKTFNEKNIYDEGFFFRDEQDILTFCDTETKIAKVSIPEGDVVVPVYNNGYRAHRIILSDIKDLWTVDTFQWLVDQGVNIHALGDVALQLAAYKGYLDIVKFLINHGSIVHTGDSGTLLFASQKGHLDIVKYLIEHNPETHSDCDDALCLASEYGHLDIVKYLTEHGADIHVNGDIPLRLAILGGHSDSAKYLIEQGSDVKLSVLLEDVDTEEIYV